MPQICTHPSNWFESSTLCAHCTSVTQKSGPNSWPPVPLREETDVGNAFLLSLSHTHTYKTSMQTDTRHKSWQMKTLTERIWHTWPSWFYLCISSFWGAGRKFSVTQCWMHLRECDEWGAMFILIRALKIKRQLYFPKYHQQNYNKMWWF